MASFASLSDLKDYLKITSDETDFDAELPRHLSAAKQKVIRYCDRQIFETLPDSPESTDMLVDDTVNQCILDLASYFFEAKGAVNPEVVEGILDSLVGDLRIRSF